MFMLGAIETFVTSALLRNAPHEFDAGLRELAQLVLTAYLDEESADSQLEHLLAA